MKTASKTYIEKVKMLSAEDQERLLSRMTGKLPKRFQKEKLTKEEALAIQMEVEDEQLQEWRSVMMAMETKAIKAMEKAAKKAEKAKEAQAKKARQAEAKLAKKAANIKPKLSEKTASEIEQPATNHEPIKQLAIEAQVPRLAPKKPQ